MKVAMIGFLGLSPAVMTELARYLMSEGLSDVIMLPTKSDEVIAGARLVEVALNAKYPKLRVHIHTLPMKDVISEKDNLIAARELARAICKELYEFKSRKIFLNAAGGRKETTIMAALIGMYFGITAVYHVVNRNIKTANIYQEKIKDIIMKFKEPDHQRRLKMYKENEDKIDVLLFPDPRDIKYIRIPVIPPTREEVALLKRILKKGGVDLTEEKIPEYNLELYRLVGLITYDRYRVWPTDLGIEIGKMLRCEYR